MNFKKEFMAYRECRIASIQIMTFIPVSIDKRISD